MKVSGLACRLVASNQETVFLKAKKKKKKN